MIIPVEFVQEDCAQCGMLFMVTKVYQKRKDHDKTSFHCPDGHGMSYQGKTKEQILREELSVKNIELGRISSELITLKEKTKRKPRKKKTT